MSKLIPVLTYFIFVSYCLYMVWTFIIPAKAQEEQDEEESCLTRAEVIDMVRHDHTLSFLRPVIEPYTNRAIAFFYTQVELKDSKYFTTALLVDRKDGGGMLIVGTDKDSYCSWASIPVEHWDTVVRQLEGVWA
jgi:hypothetical protein